MTLSSKALKRWIYVRKFFPRIQSTLVFFNTYNINFFEFSVSFQNYNDREEVLRRSKLIRGLSTPGASGRGVKPMGCHSAPHLYLTVKSFSEVLLFAEHVENMFCTKIVLDVRNNFCTQYVLPRFCAWNFHVLNL